MTYSDTTHLMSTSTGNRLSDRDPTGRTAALLLDIQGAAANVNLTRSASPGKYADQHRGRMQLEVARAACLERVALGAQQRLGACGSVLARAHGCLGRLQPRLAALRGLLRGRGLRTASSRHNVASETKHAP